MSNKLVERMFQLFAAALIGVAVYYYLSGNMDRVFVAAVLGSLCFFIGIRFQVKERLQNRDDDRQRVLAEQETEIESADALFEKEISRRDNYR